MDGNKCEPYLFGRVSAMVFVTSQSDILVNGFRDMFKSQLPDSEYSWIFVHVLH